MRKTNQQLKAELEEALANNKKLTEQVEALNASMGDVAQECSSAKEALDSIGANENRIITAARALFSWKWKVLPDLTKMGSEEWTKLTGQFDALKKAVNGEK